MLRLRLLLVVLLGAWFGTPDLAGARPASTDSATADKSSEALRKAYRSKPAPELLLQLGLLLQQEGRTLEARDYVRRALAELPPSYAGTQRAQADELLKNMPPESAELRLTGLRSAVVILDDKVVGVLPLPLPLLVSPGPHRVQLELANKHWQIEVTVPTYRAVDVRFAQDSNAAVVTTPPSVLLLPAAEREGEIPLALLKGVERALRRAKLARAAIEGRPAAPLGGKGCVDSLACQLQLAEQKSVDFVLTLRGQSLGEKPAAAFELIDVAVGDVALREEVGCPGCDLAALATKLADSMEPKLVEAVTRARGEIMVTSDPATAEVYRGKIRLGATPLKRPAWPGALQLSLRLPQHEPQSITLNVVENQVAKETVKLKALPSAVAVIAPQQSAPPPPTKLPRWRLALGIAGLSAGLFTVGVGAAALAVDGRCTTEVVPPAQVCDAVFQTQPLGIGLTVSGALVVGGSLLFITLPSRR